MENLVFSLLSFKPPWAWYSQGGHKDLFKTSQLVLLREEEQNDLLALIDIRNIFFPILSPPSNVSQTLKY